ncbi:helix-turn-helix domain-containing protein [Miniphocaeibacter halophilus]|uniref:helix-turn-helix domain-containing protein n=1 Tax=Miniphocaeibacter halophilus TaxID=2931922 RepID=UPI001FB40F64|nr:helix-turn-helix transcriptional regulator [Miniphocaeibacter halophilus]
MISERLQNLRKERNYSQEELAEKLNISRQAISKWESGQGNPDIDNIIKLSEIYNISTDYILLGKDIKNNSSTNYPSSIQDVKKILLYCSISAIAIILTIGFVIKSIIL